MLDIDKPRSSDLRVFVSYTTKDPAITKEKLEGVEAKIKPFVAVFIDLLHNSEGNQIRVDRELYQCDVVLLIESSQYKSDWVQKEVNTAIEMGKPIVKLTIDEFLKIDNEGVFRLFSRFPINDVLEHMSRISSYTSSEK